MGDDDFRGPHLRDADFLGAFGVLESSDGILMVQNRRMIDGRERLTWDLPGGQVEPGEDLRGALARELEEELGVRPEAEPEFLFVQEGARTTGSERRYMWRAFFFRVRSWRGSPTASSEILACRWIPPAALAGVLCAPYHDSFQLWLATGGRFFSSVWAD